MEFNENILEKNITRYIVINDTIDLHKRYNDSISQYTTKAFLSYWIIFIEKNNCIYVSVSTSLKNLIFNKIEDIRYFDILKKLEFEEKKRIDFNGLIKKNIKNVIGEIQYKECSRIYFNSKGINKQYKKYNLSCYVIDENKHKRLCFDNESVDIFRLYCINKQLEILPLNNGKYVNVSIPFTYETWMKFNHYFGSIEKTKEVDLPILNLEHDIIDQIYKDSKSLYIAQSYPNKKYIRFNNIYMEMFGNVILIQLYKKNKNKIQLFEITTTTYTIKKIYHYNNDIYIELERG